jgi:hypothetical protein
VVVLLCLAGAGTAWSYGLLAEYESGDRVFEETLIGEKVVYFHQRTLGEAIVEKDYIVYQFDKDTGQLLARRVHWRDDIRDKLPEVLISRHIAESMVDGDVQTSRLYIISPESDVFPIQPTPTNPCWVVRSLVDGRMIVTIIDAVDGTHLGHGVPPPYTAFSFTGPWECPYYGAWTAWYQSAESWFNTMGYVTEGIQWAERSEIRGHVKSDSTAMFYELNHGGYDSFSYGCDGSSWLSIGAWQVATWMVNYAKMPFTFLGSCEGMCSTDPVSFSDAFRKGSFDSTTTVGYCGMSETRCEICWAFSLDWQDALFNYMNQGWTVKAAFDQANANYPTCFNNDCMVFAGDESFATVPVVERDPWAPLVTVISPDGGEILEQGTLHDIEWIAVDNARVVSITILLSTDGGSTFPDTVAVGEINDSSFTWIVPDVDSKTARIKVVAIDGALKEGYDLSDGDFTLWGSISGVSGPWPEAKPTEVVLDISGGNPVSDGTGITFGIPGSAHVRMGLFDVTGRLIATLIDGRVAEGYHTVRWSSAVGDGIRPAPGIYFVRLECDWGSKTAKAILAR